MSEVLAAIAALGALFAAWIAAKHTKKLLDTESARDERSAESRRQEHAAAVACWPAVVVEGPDDHRYGVAIRNASNTVIYKVTITSRGAKGIEQRPIRLTSLPPDTYFIEEGRPFGWEFARSVSEFDHAVRAVTKGERRTIAALEFRDAANVHWRRAGGGLLECLEGAEDGQPADVRPAR